MSNKVTGDEGWEILEANYPHKSVSKMYGIVAGVSVVLVVLWLASVSLGSGVKWMSVWVWIGAAAALGFVVSYLFNLYLECRLPENKAYCQARDDLSLGKAIDRAPQVVGVVGR